MEAVVDPGQVILDEITVLEAERARTEALIAAKMLEFQDLRRARANRHEDPRTRDLEVSFVADELGTVLHQPTHTVQCRLAEARRIRNLMPLTWEAFGVGLVDAHRVSLIASATAKLTNNHHLIHLDGTVVAYASTHTTAQLKAHLRRFVARWEPDHGSRRARTEMSKRGVWLDHQDDGMSFLRAYIRTTDAVRIDAMLTRRAKGATDTPDTGPRTLDQRRADELVAQLLDTTGTTGEAGTTSSRAVIGITVPVTSLAGLDDAPGESFDGSFALPAELVRDLAHEPGTLFHRVITDPLGRILDVTELGRFPTDKLRIAVEIRDGTCRFPTCTRPVMESDLDHDIPWPEGPTTGDNLRGLCRRHHRIKTHRIAEPTDLRMRPHTRSRREIDLAHFTLRVGYAA